MEFDAVDTDADVLDVEANYNNSGGRFWVLTDLRGTIVGTVGIAKLSSDVCELRKMYLLPEWRGRGLGKHMLGEAIAFARSSGFEMIHLDTHTQMLTAIGLYRAHGFVERAGIVCDRCDLAFELTL
jgi:putative acetyltransferase